MTEDGGGIFGSIVAGSTKGRRDGVLSSNCAAPMAEHAHSRRKINPITSIGLAEFVFITTPFI
jgi:hypothetical protein